MVYGGPVGVMGGPLFPTVDLWIPPVLGCHAEAFVIRTTMGHGDFNGYPTYTHNTTPVRERLTTIPLVHYGIRRILPIGVGVDRSLWYLLSISTFLKRWCGVWWYKGSIHTVSYSYYKGPCFHIVLAVCHFRVFPVYGGAYLYDGIHILVYYLWEVHNDYQIYPSVDMLKYWYAIITPNRTTPNMANPITITIRLVIIFLFSFSLVPFIEFLRVSF